MSKFTKDEMSQIKLYAYLGKSGKVSGDEQIRQMQFMEKMLGKDRVAFTSIATEGREEANGEVNPYRRK